MSRATLPRNLIPAGMPRARFRDALAISLTIMAVAISYGAVSHAAGLRTWQTFLLAALALGGTAEFIFVGVIAAGGAPLFGVIGGLLVNSRNFAFGLNVGPYIPLGWRRFVAAHFVNDETTAFSRAAPNDYARWQSFVVMAVLIGVSWVGGAVIGQKLGAFVDTNAFGLDVAFPVILFSLIMPDLRVRATAAMAILGGVLAVIATPFLPLGMGVIVALLALLAAVLTGVGRRTS